MPREIYRVFVSSTWEDLRPEREAVDAALREMFETKYWGMEYFGSRDGMPREVLLSEVDQSDIYVGIIGARYGSGITEAEYRRARQRQMLCILYFKNEAAIPEEARESDTEQAARLVAFKKELSQSHIIAGFAAPHELALRVERDLRRAIHEHDHRPSLAHHVRRPASRETQELRALRDFVRTGRIEGLIQRAPHGTALIALEKTWSEEADHPWDIIIERPGRRETRLPRNKPTVDIFHDVGESLLILGEPGAGKTTTLCELARGLMAHINPATVEDGLPIIVHLSSWHTHYSSFIAWLTQEISEKYQVSEQICAAWLTNNRLVLLLDGLDEVRDDQRTSCVQAINAFRTEMAVLKLAVCSRLREYEALPVKLRLLGTLRLEPLTTEQVEEYLHGAGPRLAALCTAWTTDKALQTLATSPFMLDIMAQAYADARMGTLESPHLTTTNARRTHLFDTYISRMFAHRRGRESSYTRAQTLHWLSWLARQMVQHSYSEFRMERLQPSWLATRCQQLLYIVCSRLLVFAIIPVLFSFLPSEWLFRLTPSPGPTAAQYAQGAWISFMIAIMLVILTDTLQLLLVPKAQTLRPPAPLWKQVAWIALCAVLVASVTRTVTANMVYITALGGGIGVGLLFIRRSCVFSIQRDVYTVQALTWSGAGALKGAIGAFCITCVMFALIFVLVFYSMGQSHLLRTPQLLLALLRTPQVWSVLQQQLPLLGGGVFLFLEVGILLGGLRVKSLETTPSPNYGITSGIGNAARVAVAMIINATVFTAVASWYVPAWSPFIPSCWLLTILPTLWYGAQDTLYHGVLRVLLGWSGTAPWNIAHFLDYATQLMFLQKAGGSYSIHRMWLEHFAAMTYEPQSPADKCSGQIHG